MTMQASAPVYGGGMTGCAVTGVASISASASLALTVSNSSTVAIGPIATVEELDVIRAKLAEAEIEATPVSLPAVPAPP